VAPSRPRTDAHLPRSPGLLPIRHGRGHAGQLRREDDSGKGPQLQSTVHDQSTQATNPAAVVGRKRTASRQHRTVRQRARGHKWHRMGPSVLSPSAPGRGTPCCYLRQDDSLALDGLCCSDRSPSAGVSTSAVPHRRLTCRAHQRTPLVRSHMAYDGLDNYRGELLKIYRIHANHGWFLRQRSSLVCGVVRAG